MHASRVSPIAATLAPSRLAVALVSVALLMLLAAAGCGWQVLRQSGMLRPTFDGFAVDMRGVLQLQQGGRSCRVSLQPASVALPLLVALCVSDDNGRRHRLLVWPDAVPADTHRALRVYVRWCRGAGNPETERM
ncbi:protein YgfX [Vogesella indigofera]|uniref:protein YgfX n=1 Tax=Vogesella indigofera TaxID=45465 RepID=UPI00234ED3DC|nr:protein YgfX [Vogesella indigofera]MDC7699976.1 hypothetical protein [Vogesella indigofera]